jgi:hypothetical protein
VGTAHQLEFAIVIQQMFVTYIDPKRDAETLDHKYLKPVWWAVPTLLPKAELVV